MNLLFNRSRGKFVPHGCAIIAASLISGLIGWARADDVLKRRSSWQPTTAKDVRPVLDNWLDQQELADEQRQNVDAIWNEFVETESGPQLLERTVKTFAAAVPEAARLIATCRGGRQQFTLPEFPLLADDNSDPFVRNNLKLFYARWLAQQRMYDEAIAQIGDLKPADVVDPASLLFYQGISWHRLINKEKCLPVLAQLLENDEQIPRRYAELARLMEADLSPLKSDSLDEIARLMDSITNRLVLGRAGQRVRQEEEDVIAKLDKMIEDLEKQQQQQQSGGAGGSNRPSQPMQDSNPGSDSGPGNVDPKRLKNGSDWGDLPPKQRQEALQQISKDFPSHYREVIEQYFRKLARDGVER